MKLLTQALKSTLLIPATLLTIGVMASRVNAQSQIYSPVPLPDNQEITDSLSSQDIPTGFGGFARDYTIELKAGDQVAIDVTSNEFDTLVSLMSPDGATIGENDDGPDGTTNSLLFARITEPGTYTVRVRSYAGQGEGEFLLKLARLRPANEVCP
ncbi:PPC domain-containing protein [Almyronema epifaneia]|uniref:PPC domain-containing protein n=1 Tax=Almyronema epifaneia S1 TaxID=2991925 RepID=A0ABW6IKB3_9CYAN